MNTLFLTVYVVIKPKREKEGDRQHQVRALQESLV